MKITALIFYRALSILAKPSSKHKVNNIPLHDAMEKLHF